MNSMIMIADSRIFLVRGLGTDGHLVLAGLRR